MSPLLNKARVYVVMRRDISACAATVVGIDSTEVDDRMMTVVGTRKVVQELEGRNVYLALARRTDDQNRLLP